MKNHNDGLPSQAQFTIKHMHSDSNPFGCTTVWCRYFIRGEEGTSTDLYRNDYTHAIVKDTGAIDNIQCYYQSGDVAEYEYRVWGLGASA